MASETDIPETISITKAEQEGYLSKQSNKTVDEDSLKELERIKWELNQPPDTIQHLPERECLQERSEGVSFLESTSATNIADCDETSRAAEHYQALEESETEMSEKNKAFETIEGTLEKEKEHDGIENREIINPEAIRPNEKAGEEKQKTTYDSTEDASVPTIDAISDIQNNNEAALEFGENGEEKLGGQSSTLVKGKVDVQEAELEGLKTEEDTNFVCDRESRDTGIPREQMKDQMPFQIEENPEIIKSEDISKESPLEQTEAFQGAAKNDSITRTKGVDYEYPEEKLDSSFLKQEDVQVSGIMALKNIETSEIIGVAEHDKMEELKHSFVQQNEAKGKLQQSLDIASEDNEKTSSSENVETFPFIGEEKPIKTLEESLEEREKGNKQTATNDITGKIDADEKHQSAEVEFSNKNVGDIHVRSPLVDETMQVESGNLDNIYKFEQEQVHELDEAPMKEECNIGNKLEANQTTDNTESELTSPEEAAPVELNTRTSENTEALDSTENLDGRSTGNIKETKEEEPCNLERSEIKTKGEDNVGTISEEHALVIPQRTESMEKGSTELSSQKVVEGMELELNSEGKGSEPEEDDKNIIVDLKVHPKITDREVANEQIITGDIISTDPIKKERMDSHENEKEEGESTNEQSITESYPKDLSLDFVGDDQLKDTQDNKKEEQNSIEEQMETAGGIESHQNQTSQDNETPQMICDTTMVKQEESLKAASVNMVPMQAMTDTKYLDEALNLLHNSPQIDADVEVSNNSFTDTSVSHPLVEETIQVESRNVHYISNFEPEEQVQELNESSMEENENIESALEANQNTELEKTCPEGVASMELNSTTCANTELDSKEYLDSKSDGNMKGTKEEEVCNPERCETKTKGKVNANVEYASATAQSAECTVKEKVEQTSLTEVEETERVLNGEGKGCELKEDVESNFIDAKVYPKITDSEEVICEQNIEGDVISPETSKDEKMDAQENEDEHGIITESNPTNLYVDFLGDDQLKEAENSTTKVHPKITDTEEVTNKQTIEGHVISPEPIEEEKRDSREIENEEGEDSNECGITKSYPRDLSLDSLGVDQLKEAESSTAQVQPKIVETEEFANERTIEGSVISSEPIKEEKMVSQEIKEEGEDTNDHGITESYSRDLSLDFVGDYHLKEAGNSTAQVQPKIVDTEEVTNEQTIEGNVIPPEPIKEENEEEEAEDNNEHSITNSYPRDLSLDSVGDDRLKEAETSTTKEHPMIADKEEVTNEKIIEDNAITPELIKEENVREGEETNEQSTTESCPRDLSLDVVGADQPKEAENSTTEVHPKTAEKEEVTNEQTIEDNVIAPESIEEEKMDSQENEKEEGKDSNEQSITESYPRELSLDYVEDDQLKEAKNSKSEVHNKIAETEEGEVFNKIIIEEEKMGSQEKEKEEGEDTNEQSITVSYPRDISLDYVGDDQLKEAENSTGEVNTKITDKEEVTNEQTTEGNVILQEPIKEEKMDFGENEKEKGDNTIEHNITESYSRDISLDIVGDDQLMEAENSTAELHSNFEGMEEVTNEDSVISPEPIKEEKMDSRKNVKDEGEETNEQSMKDSCPKDLSLDYVGDDQFKEVENYTAEVNTKIADTEEITNKQTIEGNVISPEPIKEEKMDSRENEKDEGEDTNEQCMTGSYPRDHSLDFVGHDKLKEAENSTAELHSKFEDTEEVTNKQTIEDSVISPEQIKEEKMDSQENVKEDGKDTNEQSTKESYPRDLSLDYVGNDQFKEVENSTAEVNTKIADTEEVINEQTTEGNDMLPEPIKEEKMDSGENEKEEGDNTIEHSITESYPRDISLDVVGDDQLMEVENSAAELHSKFGDTEEVTNKQTNEDSVILPEPIKEEKLDSRENVKDEGEETNEQSMKDSYPKDLSLDYVGDDQLKEAENSTAKVHPKIADTELVTNEQAVEGNVISPEPNKEEKMDSRENEKEEGDDTNEHGIIESYPRDLFLDFVGDDQLKEAESSTAEVHPKVADTEEVINKQTIEGNFISPEPIKEEKMDSRENEKEEGEDTNEQCMTESYPRDLSLDFVGHDQLKKAENSTAEELETAGAVEYNQNQTIQDNEITQKISDNSLVKQEESLEEATSVNMAPMQYITEDERNEGNKFAAVDEDHNNNGLVECNEIISSKDNRNEAEEDKNNKLQSIKEGSSHLSPNFVGEDSITDFPGNGREADKCNEQISLTGRFQELETAGAVESIQNQTSQENKIPQRIFETTIVKQEENLQEAASANIAPMQTMTEDEVNEKKSSVAAAEDRDKIGSDEAKEMNSKDNKNKAEEIESDTVILQSFQESDIVTANARITNKTSQDDQGPEKWAKEESGKETSRMVEQILQEDDQVEKLEGLSNVTSEQYEENALSTMEKNTASTEGEWAIKNPVETSEYSTKQEETKGVDDTSACQEISEQTEKEHSIKCPGSIEMEITQEKYREDQACEGLETSSMIIEKENIVIESIPEVSPLVGEETAKDISKDDEYNMVNLKEETKNTDSKIIEQIMGTTPTEAKETETSEDRTEPNTDPDTFNTAEASKGKAHLVASNKNSLEALNSEVPENEIEEDAFRKEKSTLHDSDSAFITVVTEEASSKEAEQEDIRKVKSSDLDTEGNRSGSIITEGASLYTVSNNVKLEGNSNLEEMMDKEMYIVPNEVRGETEKEKQDEVLSTGRDSQKEMNTGENPLDGILADNLQDSSKMPLEEHDTIAVEERGAIDEKRERDETTFETAKIPFSLQGTEENLMQKEDEFTTLNVVHELEPFDVEKNIDDEVQKNLDEEHPKAEKNASKSKREEMDEHANQSEIYELPTQKDDEALNLGSKKEKSEDGELSTVSSKCAPLGTSTDTAKAIQELEDCAVSSQAGPDIEKAADEMEEGAIIPELDSKNPTKENLQPTKPDEKLECTSKILAVGESNEMLPETDDSQNEENSNIVEGHNWKFVEEQIIRQQFQEGDRETEENIEPKYELQDHIDSTGNQKENIVEIVCSDKVQREVDKHDGSQNNEGKVIEEEDNEKDHTISLDVETVDKGEVSDPISTQYLKILDTEKKEPGSSAKQSTIMKDREASDVTTNQGVSDTSLTSEVQGLRENDETEPGKKLDIEKLDADADNVSIDIPEPSLGEPQLDNKPEDAFTISTKERVIEISETTGASLHICEVDSMKPEETTQNLASQLSTFDQDKTDKECIVVEDPEADKVNISHEVSDTVFKYEDQIVKETDTDEAGTTVRTEIPEKSLGEPKVDDKPTEVFLNTSYDRDLETIKEVDSMKLEETSTDLVSQLANFDSKMEEEKCLTMEDPEMSGDCGIQETDEKLTQEKHDADEDDTSLITAMPEISLGDLKTDDRPLEDFLVTSDEKALETIATTEASLHGDVVHSTKLEDTSSHMVSQLSTFNHHKTDEESVTAEDPEVHEVSRNQGVSDIISLSENHSERKTDVTEAGENQTAKKLDAEKDDTIVSREAPETDLGGVQQDDNLVDNFNTTSDDRVLETVEISEPHLHSEVDSLKPEGTSSDSLSQLSTIELENTKKENVIVEITNAESSNQGDEEKDESRKSLTPGKICVIETSDMLTAVAAETNFGEAQIVDQPAQDVTVPSYERSLKPVETTEAILPGKEVDTIKLEETTPTLASQLPTVDGETAKRDTAEVSDANEVEETEIFSDVVFVSKDEASEETGKNHVVKRLDEDDTSEVPTATTIETRIVEAQPDEKPEKAFANKLDEKGLKDIEMTEASLQGEEIDCMKLEETTSDRVYQPPTINHGNTEQRSAAEDEDRVEDSKLSSNATFESNNQSGEIDETEKSQAARTPDADGSSESVTATEASLDDTQLDDKLQKALTTSTDERSLEIIGTAEASISSEGGSRMIIEETTANLVSQLQTTDYENAEKENIIVGTRDADTVEETKISSYAANQFKDQEGEENGKSLIMEKLNPDETSPTVTLITEEAGLEKGGQSQIKAITSTPDERIIETIEVPQNEVKSLKLQDNSSNMSSNDCKDAEEVKETKQRTDEVLESGGGLRGTDETGESLAGEMINPDNIENEIAAEQIPTVEKSEEQLQTSTSTFPIEEQENKSTTAVKKLEEDNVKEVKTIEDHSATMVPDEPCLQKEEDWEFNAPNQGVKSNKDLQRDSSATCQGEGRLLDGVLELECQEEKYEIINVSSLSESEQMTEMTRPSKEDSDFKSETSEGASQSVLEVCSHEVLMKSEDEKLVETICEGTITDLKTEEHQKTDEGSQLIDFEVPNEKIKAEMEGSKSQEEHDLDAEEISRDKTDKISQTTINSTLNEELVGESKNPGPSERMEERMKTEDQFVVDSDQISMKDETDIERFPDEHERKNDETIIKVNLENQNCETISENSTGKATLTYEESGMTERSEEGTMTNREASEINPDSEQQVQYSHSTAQRQIPEENLNENTETVISTRTEDVSPMLNKPNAATLEFDATEFDPEVKSIDYGGKQTCDLSEKTTEESTTIDSNKISLSHLLQRSKKETLPVAGHLTEQEKSTVGQEEMRTQVAEAVSVEEPKTEDRDGEEHEKSDQTDPGSDAPVIVEASRDIDVKTAHKKSHGILSGVGSKVKHSISKVKKVITGKSSHPKTLSPK